VEQFDTLIPTLTVGEMLLYTAELKRSMSEPLSSKQEAVAELLKKLALEGCKDVVVGSAFLKGISGGQAKRTNIGIALITNPRCGWRGRACQTALAAGAASGCRLRWRLAPPRPQQPHHQPPSPACTPEPPLLPIPSGRVLFLDEPTSGLDSYTANEVRDAAARLGHLPSRSVSVLDAGSQPAAAAWACQACTDLH
jgi:hypothetical protein